MMINYEGLFASFQIMWKGMAGLFLVSIFIMLLVIVIKHFMLKGKPEKQQDSL